MSLVRRSLRTKIAATVSVDDQRPETFGDISNWGGDGLTKNIYRYGSGAGALIGGVSAGAAARVLGGSVGKATGFGLAGAALGGLGGLGLTELFGGPQLRQQRRALKAEQTAYDRAQRYLDATGKREVVLPDRPRNRSLGRGIGALLPGPAHTIGATIDMHLQHRDLANYLAEVDRATHA